jgi:hypothetical protein
MALERALRGAFCFSILGPFVHCAILADPDALPTLKRSTMLSVRVTLVFLTDAMSWWCSTATDCSAIATLS